MIETTLELKQFLADSQSSDDEKSVFDVNVKDLSESADALLKNIEVVSARPDADGTALFKAQETEALNIRESARHLVPTRVAQLLG